MKYKVNGIIDIDKINQSLIEGQYNRGIVGDASFESETVTKGDKLKSYKLTLKYGEKGRSKIELINIKITGKSV